MPTTLSLPAQRAFSLLVVLALALGALVPLVAPAPTRAATNVFINEIHYDNVGTDAGEFVEIAGPAGTDLTGWSIVRYNGNGGAVYTTPAASNTLTGAIADQQNGFGTAYVAYPANGLQNGGSAATPEADGIALVNGTTVVQFLSYEGTFTATSGPAAGMTSVNIGVSEAGSEALGLSLQLQGTGTTYEEFTWSTPIANTQNAVNTGQTFGSEPENAAVTVSCEDLPTDEGVAATTDVTATDPDGTVDDISIAVTPTPAAGSIAITAEAPATTVGGTATATITVDAAVPAGSYDVTVSATNTDVEEQTGTCDLTVTVAAEEPPVATGVVINELDADNVGTDAVEFVELYDGGAGSTDLTGLVLVFYNGSNDLSYRALDLDGLSTGATGYFVAGNAGVSGVDLVFPGDSLQNGQDAAALYVGNAADFPNGSAVTTANLVDAIVYDTADADDPGLLVLLNPGQPQVDENGGGSGTTDSSGRCPNGSGGQRNTASYVQAPPTPDAVNACPGDDAPPTVLSTVPADGAVFVAPDSNISITFSEDVGVAAGWYEISCALSGIHTATVTPPGPASAYTLDPDADFTDGEECTVTINAELVTDRDGARDPMAADHVFSFTIGAACGNDTHFIHQVQGDGFATPIAGTTVTIEGIVVADHQGPSPNMGGFFLQEEDGEADANAATSEGIFVFDGNGDIPVAAGDLVSATGSAAESFDMTQLSGVTNVTVCETAAETEASASPVLIVLPVAAIGDWEAWEGMLAQFEQTMTVTENFNLGRFGEVVLSSIGRQFQGTHLAAPGPEAAAVDDLNSRTRIVLDDANTSQNADPTRYPTGGLSASNTLRTGATVEDLTAVVHEAFGTYRLQPAVEITFQGAAARPATPPSVGGRIQVAAFNVLNYFNGEPAGNFADPDNRGAENAFEFGRQRTKIIEAIAAIDAEVVGLMEIENDDSRTADVSAIEDLVAGLNAKVGAGTYAFIETGPIGTDAIAVAIIYQSDSVTPRGAFAILDTSVDPRFLDQRNRPTLAQSFTEISTGAVFTVAVNHLKSKGSDCGGAPDDQPDSGGGNCNGTRTAAAAALADWLATDPTGSGDQDRLIIGDLNSYAMESPITTLLAADYKDLMWRLEGPGAYTYVFEGASGYLDHALSSPTMRSQVTDAAPWHINADEPPVLDYNTNFKSANHVITLYAPDVYRASDHDPILIGLDLRAPPKPKGPKPRTAGQVEPT